MGAGSGGPRGRCSPCRRAQGSLCRVSLRRADLRCRGNGGEEEGAESGGSHHAPLPASGVHPPPSGSIPALALPQHLVVDEAKSCPGAREGPESATHQLPGMRDPNPGGTGCSGQDGALGTGRSGHPIPAAGPGPDSGLCGAPPGAPAPPLHLVLSQKGFWDRSHVPPKGPGAGDGGLGWTGGAGGGAMGLSPRSSQIWG